MRGKDISVVPVVDNPKDRRYLGTSPTATSSRSASPRGTIPRSAPRGARPARYGGRHTETELTGFKIEQLEETDAHIRSTIVVVDGNKRVVGFIPHPEFIQG